MLADFRISNLNFLALIPLKLLYNIVNPNNMSIKHAQKPRFLITTALESSWKHDCPILFLGEWCKRYDRSHIWASLDFEVAEPYGLCEGQKDNDHATVVNVSEKLLIALKDFLNHYHMVDYDLRFWRIVLGHWVHRYVSVVWNRWYTIKKTLFNYKISGSLSFDSTSYKLTTLDSLSFIWACSDDRWNHELYLRILRQYSDTTLVVGSNSLGSLNGFREPSESLSKRLPSKRLLRKMIAGTLQSLSKKNDALVINTYLPLLQEFKLQVRLGQIPQLWDSGKRIVVEPDFDLRKRLTLNNSGFPQFEKFLYSLVLEALPTCYLEGFPSLQHQVSRLPWPKSPKFIFTSSNFDTDEVFKVWAAHMVRNGVPYYTGQHGANYGVSKGRMRILLTKLS